MAKSKTNSRFSALQTFGSCFKFFLIITVSVAMGSGSSFPPPSSTSESLFHLKIMTYNILQIPNILGFNDLDQERRLIELVKAIKGLDVKPDVIVFQELLAESDYKKLSAELTQLYPHQVWCRGKGDEDSCGIGNNCEIHRWLLMYVKIVITRSAFHWRTAVRFSQLNLRVLKRKGPSPNSSFGPVRVVLSLCGKIPKDYKSWWKLHHQIFRGWTSYPNSNFDLRITIILGMATI